MTIKTCLYCKEKYDDDTHCEPCPHDEMAVLYGPSQLPLGGDALKRAADDEFSAASLDAELDRLAKISGKRQITLAELMGSPHPPTPEDPDELVEVKLIGGMFDGQVLEMKAIHAYCLNELMPQINSSGKTRVAVYVNKHDRTFVFDKLSNLDEIEKINGTFIQKVSKSETPNAEEDDGEDDSRDDDDDEYGLFADSEWKDS